MLTEGWAPSFSEGGLDSKAKDDSSCYLITCSPLLSSRPAGRAQSRFKEKEAELRGKDGTKHDVADTELECRSLQL